MPQFPNSYYVANNMISFYGTWNNLEYSTFHALHFNFFADMLFQNFLH